MKTVVHTPESSVKSSTTNMGGDRSESRDSSSYYHGCRRDANCKCDICLASINATLDLMPMSSQRSSLTKFSASKPLRRSPIAFSPSAISTPKSSTPRVKVSPPLNSTPRMIYQEKINKKRELGYGGLLMRLFLGVGLILALEFGLSWVLSRVLQPELSPDLVKNVGEESWVLQDLSERIVYLNKNLQGLVGGKILNCSSPDSTWKIIQDGLLLNSRCTLYKTAAEEVSIWGWPLQTAGLLTTTFSLQSFTILSGRVTQWTNGKVRYLNRGGNSSWAQGKWSASVVNFDGNTWILEYKRSFIIDNARLFSAALEFLKFRITRQLQKMKQKFWLMSTFGNHFRDYSESFKTPT